MPLPAGTLDMKDHGHGRDGGTRSARRDGARGARMIGYVGLDAARAAAELAGLGSDDWTDAYEEYAVGKWDSVMLMNRTGRAADKFSAEYDGAAKTTEIGRRTPYLLDLVRRNFDATRLKSVRLFRAADFGCIRPHRDYLEFARGFFRIHLAVLTHEDAFNSENRTVYRFREGEVWFVDGREIHTGGTKTAAPRIHLVMDFDADATAEAVVRPDVLLGAAGRTPCVAVRPALEAEARAALNALAPLLTEFTYREFADLFAKLPVVRDVHAATPFRWLADMARRNGDAKLLAKIEADRRTFLGG